MKLDGSRRIRQASQGDMDELLARPRKLSEQVSTHSVCIAFVECTPSLSFLYRGWDDLFTKCSENLNSLTAMKLSPYYKGVVYPYAPPAMLTRAISVFEEEASSWEEKLNRIHVLFGADLGCF